MTQNPEPTDDVLHRRYPVLAFFVFDHLPLPLRQVSQRFHDLAWTVARELPYHPETSTALRKLLEAKDCAVRASLVESHD